MPVFPIIFKHATLSDTLSSNLCVKSVIIISRMPSERVWCSCYGNLSSVSKTGIVAIATLSRSVTMPLQRLLYLPLYFLMKMMSITGFIKMTQSTSVLFNLYYTASNTYTCTLAHTDQQNTVIWLRDQHCFSALQWNHIFSRYRVNTIIKGMLGVLVMTSIE